MAERRRRSLCGRYLYLLIYMATVDGLVTAYARRTRLNLGELLRRRWKAGLVLGTLFVYAQPVVGHLHAGAPRN